MIEFAYVFEDGFKITSLNGLTSEELSELQASHGWVVVNFHII